MSNETNEARIQTARQNLRIAIAIRETTAAEVSRAADLSVNALGAFLRGKSSISYANLLRVCDVLDIPIGILHTPGSVTPGRLELQKVLSELSPEELAATVKNLSARPAPGRDHDA
ncbi:helix-turn-helix domain-containing protein [Rhodovulum marinum]|uniref:Cro/C1-type helix-turn-helix DNA-binding protein n=1 Tax=Rhodovulum marinum TaxID=320662 RepID=A0A4V2SRQ3_9RHOB|nr:helix-turn-helix transcriptional regulator [Rhodovulum marinum]TCP43956.1 Cro/C1-type helix-turn-helix DNA-binding protein [Rhodovulum marinum]